MFYMLLIKLVVILSLFSCSSVIVPSYKNMEPLEFKDLPYPWQTRYMELRSGVRIAYIDEGPTSGYNGQTIVFIHGLGSYLRFWEEQIKFFRSKGYRTVALDLPGYGKSDKPTTFEYTPDNFADVVLEFIGRLGIRAPILNGHSMGGQTALSFAIKYPDRLSGLVLTAPAGFEKFTRREQLWFRSAFPDPNVFRFQREYDIYRSIIADNFYNWDGRYQWLVEYRVRMAKNSEFTQYGYAQIKSIHGLSKNEFVRQNLDKIQVPTLIIFGEADQLIPSRFLHPGYPRDIFQYGADNIKGSKLVGLDNCGHTVQMDCAEQYNEEVYTFLRTVR